METPASRADGAKNAAGAQEAARTLVKGAKRLRCGYTTGSCAAAAAAAAVETLVSGRVCESVRITLPGGKASNLPGMPRTQAWFMGSGEKYWARIRI